MVGRSRAFTKKTAKVQKMGIFTSPQKLRGGGSIVSLRCPEVEFTSATYTGVILALRSRMRPGGTGRPPGPSTREKTSRYSGPSEPMRSVRGCASRKGRRHPARYLKRDKWM